MVASQKKQGGGCSRPAGYSLDTRALQQPGMQIESFPFKKPQYHQQSRTGSDRGNKHVYFVKTEMIVLAVFAPG